MVLAGETIIAGKVPGERIETTRRVSSSAGVTTTETVVDTVVAAVVAGRIYKVTWDGRLSSTAAADDARIKIREDSVSGTELMDVVLDLALTGRTPRTHLEVEYTADATEDKTLVFTLARFAGTGTLTAIAAANAPTYLYVDYIEDA
jgi:hypothetical protein